MLRRDFLKVGLGTTMGLGGSGLWLPPWLQAADDTTPVALQSGWIDDPVARRNWIRTRIKPYLTQQNNQILNTGKGKQVFLWKYFEEVTGSPLVPHLQEIGDCHPSGTLVTMADGSRKEIERIKVGESVLSHLGRSQKVTRTIRKSFNKSMVRLQAKGTFEDVVCTPDHLFWVNDGEWKAAGELSLDDSVFIQSYRGPVTSKTYDLLDICPDAEVRDDKLRAKGSSKWVNRFIHLDARLAYIIGAYLAEGGCSRAKGPEWNPGQWCKVDFNLGHTEEEFANTIATLMTEVFGIECQVYSVPSKPTVKYVRCQNKAVAMFFKHLMPGNTYTKEVPNDILVASKDLQLECLMGWLEGDGSCPGRKQCQPLKRNRGASCSGISVSREMITGMFRLANACGFSPTLIKEIRIQEGRVQAYIIRFGVVDTAKLYPGISDRVYPESEHNIYGLKRKLQSISAISKVATTVYCLEVEEDRSFIANGYSVHNCVSHAFGLGVDVLTAVQMLMLGKSERWIAKAATEIIYAGSRVEAGGGKLSRYSDGSMGTWAADFISKWGILQRKRYLGGRYDYTEYSGRVARELGAKGVPDPLEPLCRLHPVKTVSICRSWNECRDAIANGHLVCMCSNVGFKTRGGRDKDGFLAPSRRPWMHAMLIAGVDDAFKRPGGLIINSWGCFDEQTEVLTDEGWKLFKDLNKSEKIATLNQETHELEYQNPSCYHRYPYNDYLWHHKSRDINLVTTPNHNLYVSKRDKPNEWFLTRADECIQTIKMKKDANNSRPDKKSHIIGDVEVAMDLWLEFLGYYLSEGYGSENQSYTAGARNTTVKNGMQRTVGICQTNKKNYAIIQACLEQLPFNFCYHPASFTNHTNKDLLAELKSFGKAHEKYIPDYVWECSSRQLKILYDALMLGDGSISSPSGVGIKRTYYTSSKCLADDFQRLLLHCGLAGDISYTDRRGRDNGAGGITRYIEYRIGIKVKALEQNVAYKPILVPYQGEVFCVTVPNKVIYVRRNGRAVWVGNSNWVYGPKRHGQPEGSFWADASVINRGLRQGDSIAMSAYLGYPRLDLDYRFW